MINYDKLRADIMEYLPFTDAYFTEMPDELIGIIKKSIDKDTEIQVKHPIHYNSHPSGVECIQVASKFDYCLGNAIKYRWRRGLKDGQPSEKEDAKAQQYLKFRKQYCPELGEELTIEDVDQIIEDEINLIVYNQRKWK